MKYLKDSSECYDKESSECYDDSYSPYLNNQKRNCYLSMYTIGQDYSFV
jgi:hypothetical protein